MQQMHHQSRSKPGSSNRGGAVLLIVMVCLLLVAVIGGSALQTALRQQRQMRREADHQQAEWLAEAALDRAFVQMQSHPEYAGETWNISAAELGTNHAGAVVIRVERRQDEPNGGSIAVVAEYPSEGERGSRVSRTLPVELSP